MPTHAIAGPEGTPYEGGKFKFDLKFPAEYPFKPPKISFSTKVSAKTGEPLSRIDMVQTAVTRLE